MIRLRRFAATAGQVVGFAWRSLIRQPARATLGVLGVMAVGALLFDMLLLSEGLVISMRDLFDRQGYDVRVTASDALPGRGPDIEQAQDVALAMAAMPDVRAVMTLTIEDTMLERDGQAQRVRSSLIGVGGTGRPWTIVRGADLKGAGEAIVNDYGARTLGIEPGATITVRASCSRAAQAPSLAASAAQGAPPPVTLRVVGIAQFPFDTPDEAAAGTDAATLSEACGRLRQDSGGPSDADFFLVTSNGDPAATADAIAARYPTLRTFTNEQLIGRLQAGGFTYFQQISVVLTTVTVAFALLLITVLLTVSVNQRLGEIAALRALGFSQRRVAADVFCESALLVGIGGLLSLPLGFAMATWLDAILKRMPGIPTDLHFFAFNPGALGVHAALLVVTAVLAALYPMRVVARLPIAATLRAEVMS